METAAAILVCRESTEAQQGGKKYETCHCGGCRPPWASTPLSGALLGRRGYLLTGFLMPGGDRGQGDADDAEADPLTRNAGCHHMHKRRWRSERSPSPRRQQA